MTETDLQEQTAQRIQERHAKNLAFFQTSNPNIYETFKDYKFKNITLNVDPNNDEVDILYKGKSIYDGKARQHANIENSQFQSVYSVGKPINTLRPTFPDDFPLPRHFHRKMHDLVSQSPLTPEKFDQGGYQLGNFYPFIVFCGIGSGLHIENFIKNNDVQQVIIVETELDYFAASLYTVDWQEIYSTYQVNNGKSLSLILGDIPDPDHIFSLIWNRVIRYCPIFPLATLFYNHLANKKYEQPIAKVCSEIRLFINLFGFYDDEINQLNNCLHNLHQGIRKLPPKGNHEFSKPVCIIGGGPSIDRRIELLKRHRDKLTIVSCGTSLRTLYKNGITPDFHVELESHLVTNQQLEHTAPPEWLSQIRFLAASQVSPNAFKMFDHKRLYFKQETAMAAIFGSAEENISMGTPTCTNAVTAICSQHNAKNIFFFGMDFGYYNQKKHHSKDAIYFSKDAPNAFREHEKHQATETGTFEVEDAQGLKPVTTTNNLFHARRKVENIINCHPDIHYYNCSDGSKITGSEWLSDDNFEKLIESPTMKGDDITGYFFNDEIADVFSHADIQARLNEIRVALHDVRDHCLAVLGDGTDDHYQLGLQAFKIAHYLEKEFTEKHSSVYYFIRGSIWHLLYAGYSHSMGISNKEELSEFLQHWNQSTIDTCQGICEHFENLANRDYTQIGLDDPWLTLYINAVEPPL